MKKNVWEAAKLYMKAYRCIKKAEELLESEGIYSCDIMEGYYIDKLEPEVQIYSGIKKMESDELKIAANPPMWHTSLPDSNKGHIKIGGINFFQLKESQAMTLK